MPPLATVDGTFDVAAMNGRWLAGIGILVYPEAGWMRFTVEETHSDRQGMTSYFLLSSWLAELSSVVKRWLVCCPRVGCEVRLCSDGIHLRSAAVGFWLSAMRLLCCEGFRVTGGVVLVGMFVSVVVFLCASVAVAATWSPEMQVNVEDTSHDWAPVVVADSAGTAWVFWMGM